MVLCDFIFFGKYGSENQGFSYRVKNILATGAVPGLSRDLFLGENNSMTTILHKVGHRAFTLALGHKKLQSTFEAVISGFLILHNVLSLPLQ